MPSRNKRKGSKYELDVQKLFIELGYDTCVTSRSESKRLDDAGVDLCYTGPFYVQCKADERLGPTHGILSEMPKEKGKFNVVFHKRNHKGTVVSMTQEHFLEIVRMLRSKKLA